MPVIDKKLSTTTRSAILKGIRDELVDAQRRVEETAIAKPGSEVSVYAQVDEHIKTGAYFKSKKFELPGGDVMQNKVIK